ncbi:2,3-bisphosphoglycerate-independent phosphoglycerate mutase [Candidatus Uhrbacteria bacterium]|nr:2,3-bisphosphoglycerate-independent phosphoglycerate mutase [Candidatus Uhrbacteria bacterium]
MSRPKPVVLIIVDGFGIAPQADGNAIYDAQMPVFKRLVEGYPAMTVHGSGGAVGLSWGEMGNSEVGHLTIGAGRIFYQSLPRITLAIETEEFYSNPTFKKAVAHIKTTGGRLHLMGLLSQGNVHAAQEHLNALLEFCKREALKDVPVHCFLDGRDAIFNSATTFVGELEAKMAELGVGRIATMAGRYFAMDRDNRWDRVEKAYNAIVKAEGEHADSAQAALQASYANQVYDEQFVPTVIGQPAPVKEGDAVIFFNYRPDRAREMAKAFALPAFDKFPREYIKNLFFVTMTEYEKDMPIEVAFPPQPIETCLAKVISDAGLRQLHIAETEKYAHVTFFLNGMREDEFPGEDRVIIPSPRVSSYDEVPEMSAFGIAERVVKEIAAGSYDFIVLNFANPDMVGHTGNQQATVKACEAVDKAIGMIVDAAFAVGGAVLITADHGNAEEVKNLVTGDMDKEHSTNPVPFIIASKELEGIRAPSGDVIGGDLSLNAPVGMLADVAPTVLKLLEIPAPPIMTGQPLI